MSDLQQPTLPALVVGAGPVGLTLAAELVRHGMACRLIDRAAAPTDKSKALVLWARTLELLDDMGAVAGFLSAGMFANGAGIYANGRRVVHVTTEVRETEYPRPLMLPQNETERLLTEHLRNLGVAVERPVELTDLADKGDHVRASLRHADGRTEEVRCAWLLGCDGAHSTVRKKLGIDFAGDFEPNDWILADARLEGPLPPDEISIFWHTHGIGAFFPINRERFRAIADMGLAKNKEKPADPSLGEVHTVLAERGLGNVRLHDPIWLSGFRIHERKVAHYRRGRCFLVGDAAHIHSPAGGQGMNTGMQDACNLAWKLALVQQGRGRAAPLLDSYDQEREKVGDLVLRQARQLTTLATLRNPVAQFVRNNLARVLGLLEPLRYRFALNLSELNIHYPDSPLNGAQGSWGWGGVRPGDRLPDLPVVEPASGLRRRLHQVLAGTRHELLLLPRRAEAATLARLAEVRRRAEAAFPGLLRSHVLLPGDQPPKDGENVWLDPERVARRLGASETALVVVRPDKYVGYRAQPASWEGLREHLGRYLVGA